MIYSRPNYGQGLLYPRSLISEADFGAFFGIRVPLTESEVDLKLRNRATYGGNVPVMEVNLACPGPGKSCQMPLMEVYLSLMEVGFCVKRLDF